MTSLLDVNVLISLLDATHQHHAAAMGWWNQNKEPWASCPMTQNGYLRIVTQPGYGNTISVDQAIRKLAQVISTKGHQFLSDSISLLDQQHFVHRHIQGSKQMPDIYLLALAVAHGARFVTLDKRVPLVAVPKATSASLHVITT